MTFFIIKGCFFIFFWAMFALYAIVLFMSASNTMSLRKKFLELEKLGELK